MKKDGPMPAKEARGALFFNHMKAISAGSTDAANIGTFGLSVKVAKVFVSLDLDGDRTYDEEMDAVKDAYHDSKRPSWMAPDVWNLEKRVEELECMFRSACRQGVFKEYAIEWDTEPL